MRILITGGAGFVGSSLAVSFKEAQPSATVVAFDNLKRRGSELNLARFKKLGIQFVHGDIRSPGDLAELETGGKFDVLIEASAEPSVLAGLNSSPKYLLETNLVGTLNCLEYARHQVGQMIFLSTSRVYSIGPLKAIQLEETAKRFEIAEKQELPGVGPQGISERFPVDQPRSLYGATKLASEMVIQEYVDSYKMKAIINRCGVIAGPGQFGKVDQGVFTLWVANHFFGKPLKYTGFGAKGKQVRDLLHPADLFELLQAQLSRMDEYAGQTFNVGGGRPISTSLSELTDVCRQVTGRTTPIAEDPSTSPVDIPLYVSDSSRAARSFGWQPRRSVTKIVEDIHHWMKTNEAELRPLFT